MKEQKDWEKFSGNKRVVVHNIMDEIREANAKGCKIYLGTDSQYNRGVVTYATVIAFRNADKGVSCIFNEVKERIRSRKKRFKESEKKNIRRKDILKRLKKELNLTSNVFWSLYQDFQAENIKIHAVEFDYNSQQKVNNISFEVLSNSITEISSFANTDICKNVYVKSLHTIINKNDEYISISDNDKIMLEKVRKLAVEKRVTELNEIVLVSTNIADQLIKKGRI